MRKIKNQYLQLDSSPDWLRKKDRDMKPTFEEILEVRWSQFNGPPEKGDLPVNKRL